MKEIIFVLITTIFGFGNTLTPNFDKFTSPHGINRLDPVIGSTQSPNLGISDQNQDRFPAFNSSSGNVINSIPQIAIDRSNSLIPCTPTLCPPSPTPHYSPTVTPTPTLHPTHIPVPTIIIDPPIDPRCPPLPIDNTLNHRSELIYCLDIMPQI
jgi:hypothetical protein